jgi:integral membrane sensor domain MASE1
MLHSGAAMGCKSETFNSAALLLIPDSGPYEQGASKPWSDGSVIACLVMIPFLLAVFFAWERYIGSERAMLKLFLFKNRTVVGSCLIIAFGFAAMMDLIYYISEGMQALYK